jgi:hypothetical protein
VQFWHRRSLILINDLGRDPAARWAASARRSLTLLLTSKSAAGVADARVRRAGGNAWRRKLDPGGERDAGARHLSADVARPHLTDLLGNTVATIVMAKWEGALDETRMHRTLDQSASA